MRAGSSWTGGVLRAVVSLVLGGIVVLVGGGVGYFLYTLKEEPPRKELATTYPLVESIVLRAAPITERIEGYGSVRPDRQATLSAEVAAVVVNVVGGLEEGQPVRAGDILLRLDNRQYQQDLQRAQAQSNAEQARIEQLAVERDSLQELIATAREEVRIAEDEADRVSTLYESNDAQKREYDLALLTLQQTRRILQNYLKDLGLIKPRVEEAQAAIAGFDAAAEVARLNVERCVIQAPFDGVIRQLMVDIGDRATMGSPLLVLTDPSRVEIPIQLPASSHDSIAVGASCWIFSESDAQHSWVGQVSRIAPMADTATRTFAAYLDVDNTRQAVPLLPGRFIRAMVEGRRFDHALVVPRGAIRHGVVLVANPREPGATAQHENTPAGDAGEAGADADARYIASRRPVKIEGFHFDGARVTGDLKDGDIVILSHLDRLSDGAPIRVQPQEWHAGDVYPTAQAAAADSRDDAEVLQP